MAQENENRTFVCSVLFLDIVEYSKQPVSDQMRLKQRFNTLLGEALRNVKSSDRIVLDTGDGAAISFLGSPEEAVIVGIALRDALNPDDPKELRVRFGINLGPVRTIKDLNQNVNIIGDGINVAQRVMSFSDPGQLLISRSYYEVVSSLSSEFQQLFKYEGARTDKHVREHEVYVVGKTDPGFFNELVKTSRASQQSKWVTELKALNPVRIFVLLPIMMVLLLSLGIAVRAERHHIAPATEEIAANAGIGNASDVIAAPTMSDADASAPIATPTTEEKPKHKKKEKTAKPALSATAAGAASSSASIKVKVTPWGELFVDGADRGTCSPICELKVSPGLRRIEVRNPSSSAPRGENLNVQAGEQKTLNYSFY